MCKSSLSREGRVIGDKVKGSPEQAVSYSAMGNVLFHREINQLLFLGEAPL